jgi:thymidylate synthase
MHKETSDFMINTRLGAGLTNNFESLYFELNRVLLREGDFVDSRNGATKEMLNFKTVITDPQNRCVGGWGRDVNIFFLLAEAMWIWAGRRDVAFLEIFNSRMKDYSDNGRYFHAPYGWRMRNYNVDSDFEYEDSNKHAKQGTDQIAIALDMLSKNQLDRRVVVQIWNAELDLQVNSKDIPCNDLVFFKMRKGRLYTTIQNRSNDLHWGLLTNVFQFSFVTEMMCKILGCHPGHQVHNSNSLHLYTSLPLSDELRVREDAAKSYPSNHLYDNCITSAYSEMHFRTTDVHDRLREVDFHINSIILGLLRLWNGEEVDRNYYDNVLPLFSKELALYWGILEAYVFYKRSKNKAVLYTMLKAIEETSTDSTTSDVMALAFNFLFARDYKPDTLIPVRSERLRKFWNAGKLF